MELEPLTPPIELFELLHAQTADLAPVGYIIGKITIIPKYAGAPPSKEVRTLRLMVHPSTKTFGMSYFDITSQTLIAQILPMLDQVIADKKIIRILADGVAPKKRFTVQVI